MAGLIHEGKRVSFWWTMGVNQSYEGVRTAQAIISGTVNGDIIATPRVTYVREGAAPETREAYLHAITAALERCTPLHFSEGLGNAVAGRPIAGGVPWPGSRQMSAASLVPTKRRWPRMATPRLTRPQQARASGAGV